MSIKQVLIEARNLIADRARWTQGDYCTTEDGQSCELDEAACYCALGAIAKVANLNWFDVERSPAAVVLEVEALKESGGQNAVAGYNDSHTHEEVLALFDKAIENIKE